MLERIDHLTNALPTLVSGKKEDYAASGSASSPGSGRLRRRCPRTPLGRCAVGDAFFRKDTDRPLHFEKSTPANARRSRPGVALGCRSQNPVGIAGAVAAA